MEGKILFVLALTLGVGACTMDREQPDQGVPPGAASRTTDQGEQGAVTQAGDDPGSGGTSAYGTPGADAVTPVPNPGGGQTVQGSLQPVNNYPIQGSVSLTALGGRTQVAVTVSGVRAGTTLRMALHQGQCGRTGAQVAALNEVRVGPEGLASVTDTAQVPPATVMDGSHVLVLMPLNANPGVPPVACATIPANAAPPAAR